MATPEADRRALIGSSSPETGFRGATWLALLLFGLFGCAPSEPAPAPISPKPEPALAGPIVAAPGVSGDPTTGRRLFVSAGCGGCHTLGGLPMARGVAGPNLTNVVLRPTLAGENIPMSPESMVAWLLDPAALKPSTTMPDVGLTTQEAVDLAAFLYSQPLNPGR